MFRPWQQQKLLKDLTWPLLLGLLRSADALVMMSSMSSTDALQLSAIPFPVARARSAEERNDMTGTLLLTPSVCLQIKPSRQDRIRRTNEKKHNGTPNKRYGLLQTVKRHWTRSAHFGRFTKQRPFRSTTVISFCSIWMKNGCCSQIKLEIDALRDDGGTNGTSRAVGRGCFGRTQWASSIREAKARAPMFALIYESPWIARGAHCVQQFGSILVKSQDFLQTVVQWDFSRAIRVFCCQLHNLRSATNQNGTCFAHSSAR